MRLCRLLDTETSCVHLAIAPDLPASPLHLYPSTTPLHHVLSPSLRAELRATPVESPLSPGYAGRHRLLAPVPPPSKILCVGLNYRKHAQEFVDKGGGGGGKEDVGVGPRIFAKLSTAVAATREALVWDGDEAREVDYEGELAVVVGARCRRVGRKEAMKYVAGFTLANDVSVREWQRGDGQWTRAKGSDGFCPLGPFLLTCEEVGVGGGGDWGNLGRLGECELSTRVNGVEVQRTQVGEMVVDVAGIMEWCSRFCTLLPGDVVLTGTPEGVGMGRGLFLADGDVVAVRLEVPWSAFAMELENSCEVRKVEGRCWEGDVGERREDWIDSKEER